MTTKFRSYSDMHSGMFGADHPHNGSLVQSTYAEHAAPHHHVIGQKVGQAVYDSMRGHNLSHGEAHHAASEALNSYRSHVIRPGTTQTPAHIASIVNGVAESAAYGHHGIAENHPELFKEDHSFDDDAGDDSVGPSYHMSSHIKHDILGRFTSGSGSVQKAVEGMAPAEHTFGGSGYTPRVPTPPPYKPGISMNVTKQRPPPKSWR